MDSTLTVLTSVRDYEVCAKKLLSPMALDNLSSGRGEEQTRDDNEEAFKRSDCSFKGTSLLQS